MKRSTWRTKGHLGATRVLGWDASEIKSSAGAARRLAWSHWSRAGRLHDYAAEVAKMGEPGRNITAVTSDDQIERVPDMSLRPLSDITPNKRFPNTRRRIPGDSLLRI
jgi:hypothetical protein